MMSDLKQLLAYTKAYRKYFIFAVLFIVIETSFELVIPLIMADILDVGIANHDMHYVTIQGIKMIVCALLSLLTGLLYAKFAAKAASGFSLTLREEEFKRIQEYSFKNLDHFDNSSLITRLTSDVTVMQNAITGGLRPFVRGPIMLILGLTLAITINSKLALVFLGVTPVLAFILFNIVKRVAPKYGLLQKAVDHVNIIVQENLMAIREVKAYVREDYESIKFDKVNSNLMNTSEKTFHIAVLNLPSFQLTMYSAIILILWFGSQLIFTNQMQVGELTGFLSYVLQIMNSLMMISNVFLMITRSLASAHRICEVFNEELDLEDGNDQSVIKHGNVVYNHVYFKYSTLANEYVLSDINLDIKEGETVGVLGGIGSAKSTLVSLMPRLYDVSQGEILIDGRNIKSYSLEHLRDAVGIVLQKNVLFSGTIKENLLWGNKNATEQDIQWAIQSACADEFINKFPKGLDTDLSQGGVNLSGGQKQRLCIARTLLKKPKVIIFDDSTSAVDTATEAKIRQSLSELKDLTKIIIAQRVSSVIHADKIIILEDGHINAIGTHEQLIRTNPIYQEIYNSQQKGSDEHVKSSN